MSILPIIEAPAHILRNPARRVAYRAGFYADLIADMRQTARANCFEGLAATQVGVPFAIALVPDNAAYKTVRKNNEPIDAAHLVAMINPKIIWKSRFWNSRAELCGSLPKEFTYGSYRGKSYITRMYQLHDHMIREAIAVGEDIDALNQNVADSSLLSYRSWYTLQAMRDPAAYPPRIVDKKRTRVPRAVRIKVAYQDENGRLRHITAKDRQARFIQHEIGHLQGELISDFARLQKPKRKNAPPQKIKRSMAAL